VGLADKGHKFPSELAGGERQRVAIARSMVRQPKILIADEPTGNLDPETSWGIVRLLEEINNFGTTILVTTHDEKIVNQLRRRVITIRDGKIIGDQKSDGHYDLDAIRSQIVKRPLASMHRTAPTADEIRRATSTEAAREKAAAEAAERAAKNANRRKII
ncbi:ATP-binding cassette domain-containing protein, partial [Candidatus Saccharibacteria bacterium]|nr:ATP-binding cassette domain-containing protein [Candidatus Saccharibacteria bacterium]